MAETAAASAVMMSFDGLSLLAGFCIWFGFAAAATFAVVKFIEALFGRWP